MTTTSDNDRCAYYHSSIQMSCGGQRRFHGERYKDHDFVEPRQPTQPVSADGEWRVVRPAGRPTTAQIWEGQYLIARELKPEHAAQIVAEHNATAFARRSGGNWTLIDWQNWLQWHVKGEGR